MKIKRSSKQIYIGVSVVVICLVSYAVFASLTHSWPLNRSNTTATPDTTASNTGSQQEQTASSAIKKATVDNSSSGSSTSDSTTAGSSLTTGTVGIQITAADISNNTLYIRTLIQKITTDGTCVLTISSASGAVIYTATSGVQAGPSTSTCQGFNVPTSSIGTGQYIIHITFTDNSSTGAASRNIQL